MSENSKKKLGPNAERKWKYWTDLNDAKQASIDAKQASIDAKQAKQENNRRARQELEESRLKDLDEKMIATGSELDGKMVIKTIFDPKTNIKRFFLMRVE